MKATELISILLKEIQQKGDFEITDQRSWAKFERFWDKPKAERFDVNTLQPFDKILARDSDKQSWTCEFFPI